MSSIKHVMIKSSVFLMLVIFGLSARAEAAVAWETSDVGAATIQRSTSIAIDGSDVVHVLYSDTSDLHYVTNGSGNWVDVSLASNIGLPMGSLVLGPGGAVHVSYYDPDNNILRYITNVTGSFVLSDIDNDPFNDVGRFNSIAVDTNGKLHVSYYDATNQLLKYATNVTGSWANETIDAGGGDDVGANSSIAVDTNGKVHVSYYDFTNQTLKYATNKSGGWVTAVADGDVVNDVGQYSSIAVDISGNVHVAYYDDSNQVLKYASNSTGSWLHETVDDSASVGEHCSLAIKPNGSTAYISYHDMTNDDLKFASGSSGDWSLATLDDSGDVGKFSDIVLNSGGKLYVSYYDETIPTPSLKLANQYTLPNTGDDCGCFIATAAFGSPLEGHVMILKEFRDRILKPSSLGRVFVNSYYRHAPPVARYLSEHAFPRTIVRWSLLPIVGISWVTLHFGFIPLVLFGLVAVVVPVAWRRRLNIEL